ncbi:acyl-CoA synthetase [Kiloniella antarctica]|uniref:Acyl-CoA synthetase n=1 Tax=Kiloniella antarctica TaxID=1550907 RepID=A0ABW5BGP6_9PROT
MLDQRSSYEEVQEAFNWEIPANYNIGVDVCDKWAEREPDRLALCFIDTAGKVSEYTFGDLKDYSNKLANLLGSAGIVRGDRVAILLPQSLETAFSHIAAYKMGCIALPLFMLFGVEALEYRLSNSGAKVVITNADGVKKISEIRDRLPDLEQVYCIDGPIEGANDLHGELSGRSENFIPVQTKADDPAVIIYTSGTTGQPKGALHAHRVLLGHLPGVEISHDFFPQPGDKIWTPADWAWIGGLLDVLLPALHHGVCVVARRFEKFTAEAAFQLIAEQGIRNAFIPPTALKMMRSIPNPEQRWDLQMRSIASGGESLGTELLDWGRKTFGLTINEFYGQTECNMIVSSCAEIMDARPGVMGRPVPGHKLAIVSDAGEVLPQGELGNIAVMSPDPVMFLKYWNNPEATKAKFAGEWLLTGDTGILDGQGWIQFVGRDDDVITSSGYRIGPGEIEDCLIGHPAVRMAGVVGKPDPQRTEIVKAFIVLNNGHEGTDDLAKEIQNFVKKQLAAHEYPREVAFVDELPMTTTGKIIRRELRSLG